MLQNNNFDLQIIPGSIPPVLHLSQYDSGRQFTATLKNGSASYSVASGATAKIKGFNAAGVAWEQEATISGSTVIFTPSGAATDQFGVMPVTIEITVGEEVLTPLLVVFDIQRAGYTNEEAATSPEFQNAMEEAADEYIRKVYTKVGSFSSEAKSALIELLENVAYTTDRGPELIGNLSTELFRVPDVESITAVFTQGSTVVYNIDTLETLKSMLVVTATFADNTTAEVTQYTLSGTLSVGASTITVSYGGKTTTFTVTVTDFLLNDMLTLDGEYNTRNGHSDTATTWEDLSGNQHDFTKYNDGSLAWDTNHLKFNAEGYGASATNKQRLTATADLQGNGNLLTIEFVAKFTGHGTYTGSDGDYGVLFANAQENTPTAGRFLFRTYSNSAFTSVGYSGAYGTTGLVYMGGASTTRYVAYVFDGSKVTQYLDGTKYDSASNPKNVTYQSGTKNTGWTLGGSNNNSLYINAEIYRIGISAKAMTAQEIADRYAFFASRFGIGG